MSSSQELTCTELDKYLQYALKMYTVFRKMLHTGTK